jgi:hypothetical protein
MSIEFGVDLSGGHVEATIELVGIGTFPIREAIERDQQWRKSMELHLPARRKNSLITFRI